MFPWTKQAQRLVAQQSEIESLRFQCECLREDEKRFKEFVEKQLGELRAASIDRPKYRIFPLSMLLPEEPPKPYTAMNAVRLLLDRAGLTIETEPGKDAQLKLVPVKKTKKK